MHFILCQCYPNTNRLFSFSACVTVKRLSSRSKWMIECVILEKFPHVFFFFVLLLIIFFIMNLNARRWKYHRWSYRKYNKAHTAQSPACIESFICRSFADTCSMIPRCLSGPNRGIISHRWGPLCLCPRRWTSVWALAGRGRVLPKDNRAAAAAAVDPQSWLSANRA